MNGIWKVALCFAFVVLAEFSGRSEGPIPTLKVGDEIFTNVTILSQSDTNIVFRHAGGIGSAKLWELDESTRKQLSGESHPPVTDPYPGVFRGGTNWRSTTNLNSPPPGTTARVYQIRDTGTLSLFIPETWKDFVSQSPSNSPPSLSLRFERQYGDDFIVVVSTIPAGSELKKMGTRRMLEMTRNRALLDAFESHLDFEEINGGETAGWFFSLTDKKLVEELIPKPGQFKYQTQGAVDIADFTLSFAVFYNYLRSPDYDYALEMIRSAHFKRQ